MSITASALPKTLPELQQLCLHQAGKIQWMKSDIERLEAMLRLARHQHFGSQSESLMHPGMQSLFAEVDQKPETASESQTTAVPAHERKTSPRKPWPESLPRKDIVIDLRPEDKVCSQCGEGCEHLKKVSEHVSEKLHIVPSQYEVHRYIRPVYSCPTCETMSCQPMPEHPIPKCSVTVESLAHIATSKYLDSLPLYRQEKIFERGGIEISRDKMAKWMISLGERLEPIKQALHKTLLSGDVLHMDETTLQVLKEDGRLPTSQSYMVAQARGSPEGQGIVLFHYSPSRSAMALEPLLSGFGGILATDGLEVYNSVCQDRQGMIHVGCWAHARRKFVDALKSVTKKNRGGLAHEALAYIDELFAIERRGDSRQVHSKKVIDELNAWLTKNLDAAPSKSHVGMAMRYLSNQWSKLVKFLDNDKIPLHNNFIENAIRPFTLGRKNWLFSDGVEGAEASAILYSLLVTAKINGIHPTTYLTSALRGMARGDDPMNHLPFKKD